MPLKVYYLDDEMDLLEIFAESFSSSEVQITTFLNPEEAIATAKLNPPDLMFVDFRLPNTNGEQVAKQLDPAIPKVLLTGDMIAKTGTQFVAVFEKPFKAAAIEAFIQKYLDKQAA